jgi:DNA topoisomerase I
LESTTTDDDPCDSEAVAARAGLVHRNDDRPGMRRRRAGKGFTYLDERGRRVTGERRSWIESLAIPPAWTDVWVSPERDSHLLASGVDDAGRKQYRYHPAWIEAANAAKFERLAGFAVPLSQLRDEVSRMLERPLDEDWVCAAVVRLIDDTLIRPGSFRYFRERGTVGALTLQPDHIAVSGRRLHLQFGGKSDVEVDVVCDDALLARRMSELLDDVRADRPVFVDGSGRAIEGSRLNGFIQQHAGAQFTAKDLRTWGATCVVAEQLLAADGPEHDADRVVRAALEAAAARLGNTVAVCRSAYVAPVVIDSFVSGELQEAWRRSRRARWLSRSEQTVRRVLADG